MNEIKYEICLYISSVKLGLNVFEKTNSIKSIFFKEFDCKTILNKKEINFQEAENIIEKSIFEMSIVRKITNKPKKRETFDALPKDIYGAYRAHGP